MFAKAPALQLPNSIYSRAQIDELIRELTNQMMTLRRAGVLSRSGLKQTVASAPIASARLRDLLAANQIDGNRPEQLTRLKSALSRHLAAATEVTITLSSVPDRAALEQLVGWFRDNIHPSLLFDLTDDRDVLGGIIVRTPHAEYDWSFRSLLIAHSEDLMEIVHNVG